MLTRKTKLLIGAAFFTLVLAGCQNSTSSMKGMDHSKMNMSENTNTTKTMTSAKIETLTGKEINLTAKASNLEVEPGKILPVWTYNNSVPGPQIRVKQGETVKVNLKNELSVPVSIHWHGVPVPNAMDGIPGMTQDAVQPGKSFTYEFKADVPGTYWYHSHQDSVNQVDRGLYGSFIVEPKNDKVDKDYTLVLDEWMSSGNMGSMDMGNTKNGNMDMSNMDHSKMNMDSKSSNDNKSTDTKGTAKPKEQSSMNMAMGDDMSMYDLYTINGKTGQATDKMPVKKGDKVRIRLINAGFISHKMHLHGQEFKVTATDGQPINNPQTLKDTLISIAPGERYDIEFEANNPGQWYLEEHGNEPRINGMKTVIQYEGENSMTDKSDDSATLPIFNLANYGTPTKSAFTLDQKFDIEKTMVLNTEQKDGNTVYTINGQTYPNIPPITVKKDDTVKVTFVNQSKTEDHPMHLHGHFFQVLSKNGQPIQGSPIIKDTLNVKPGETYVVAFKADNPGDWMFHCHDLHHASMGMVTDLQYSDYKSNYKPDPKAGNKPE
ncbi:multicopper oxidase family protein [Paenibacillus chondroitinus]|uniref:Multicopper oxidase family protein n=1 Tax=Paenibacillus chondroitinus TaxID=59842 RepID=A0ABU6DH32_9BACL|nr:MULTISPECIES: multicopper oxidase family protein [Paenibacillus]MCY9659451.1 multicopper oxidase family protein [Paenibacillus anseongense]MEB4796846.1 multicopper oxidase family protein [Paenibacillus chondroitinus]